MPREKKFNFIPVSQISAIDELEKKLTVTINNKGVVFFSKKYLETYNAIGKFAKFFVDQDKKILGWTLHSSVNSLASLKTSSYRMLKMNSCKSVMVSLATTMKQLGVYGKKMTNLEVKEYKDLMLGIIDYVELPKKKLQLYPKKDDQRNEETCQS